MAKRTGYSRSYLGNAETGVRAVTPGLVRAYERVLGDDLNRRQLLFGGFSSVALASAPDVVLNIAADVSCQSNRLLTTAQTTHETDKAIAAVVAKDAPSLASLAKWSRSGSAVLRVNAAGILAKVKSPVMDNDVVQVLTVDPEVRELYLTAVMSRVLSLSWDQAYDQAINGSPLSEVNHLRRFSTELTNQADSGARWCSVIMLARTKTEAPTETTAALIAALRTEPSRENLRAIGSVLADVDPLSI